MVAKVNKAGEGFGPRAGGGPGKSAYQIAVEQGFVGTKSQWLLTLKGEPGDDGEDGQDGDPGAPGLNGLGNVTGYVWDPDEAEYVSMADTRIFIGPSDPRTAPGGRDHPSDLWIDDGAANESDFTYAVGIDDPAVYADIYGENMLGLDYEFNGSGSSVVPPTDWQWINQGAASYFETGGAGVIQSPSLGGTNARALVRPVPAGNAWSVTAKHTFVSSQVTDVAQGICLRESTTGRLLTLGYYSTAAVFTAHVHLWASAAGALTSVGSILLSPPVNPAYKRITKDGANLYSFWVSHDGRGWVPVFQSYAPGAGVFNQVGFFGHATSAAFAGSCEWMRFR